MTFEELKQVITATLPNCDAEKVTMDAMLVPEVCADSLDTVELSMALEEKFGAEVPDDLMATFGTVADLYKYLAENAR
ncbi:MAG: acyl carrier protein [Clostridia bacterium]|nr:acyl carrier protein [Clostridia bacterium]